LYYIIGLGNPGLKYKYTRHNIGFMVVDLLSQRYHLKFKNERSIYKKAVFQIENNQVELIKPMTFMNLSGKALLSLVERRRITDYSQLLIICDDINLPFGTIRLRNTGSSGGQKGLDSILQQLHTPDVPRLRIGISDQFQDAADYVLSVFNREERKQLPDILNESADAVESFVLNGIQLTMSKYNRNILEN